MWEREKQQRKTKKKKLWEKNERIKKFNFKEKFRSNIAHSTDCKFTHKKIVASSNNRRNFPSRNQHFPMQPAQKHQHRNTASCVFRINKDACSIRHWMFHPHRSTRPVDFVRRAKCFKSWCAQEGMNQKPLRVEDKQIATHTIIFFNLLLYILLHHLVSNLSFCI